MQEDEQKIPVNRFEIAYEIVFLAIMAIAVYVGAILFLGKPIAHHIPWFFGPIGPSIILLLNVTWIVGMKIWKLKSEKMEIIKKILSVLVFALSASLSTLWLILFLWSRMQW